MTIDRPTPQPAPHSSSEQLYTYRWLGKQQPYLGNPHLAICGSMIVGRYGGHPDSGAHKNEDGLLLWQSSADNWEMALLVDAHHSSQSAELILRTIQLEEAAVQHLMRREAGRALPAIQNHMVARLQSPAFRARCQFIEGEAAILFCLRKDRFVWWLSVGDCAAYLLHPELARFDQFGLNQPTAFEWVGRANTFELPVPSFSSGFRELRLGPNHLVMTTDGLLGTKDKYYQDARNIYQDFTRWQDDLEKSTRHALERVHRARVRDSATVIAWRYFSNTPGLEPSPPQS